jgi:hypothetical protein
MYMGMNLSASQKTRNVLTSWVTISFCRRTLIHDVSSFTCSHFKSICFRLTTLQTFQSVSDDQLLTEKLNIRYYWFHKINLILYLWKVQLSPDILLNITAQSWMPYLSKYRSNHMHQQTLKKEKNISRNWIQLNLQRPHNNNDKR